MAFMDMSSEDIDYEGSDSSEENSEEQNYRVRLSSANYTEVGFTNKKEVNKKRVKRVVSCKRKTRHLTLTSGVRRRPSINAKTFDAFSKDSEQAGKAEMLEGGCRELHLSVPQDSRMEEDSVIYCDYFSAISKDHKQVTEILFGRNLKLNIALTLWRRNIGELLSFLIKIRDFSVLVDCLPVFTKSLHAKCAYVSVGFCVDIFPLVKNLLRSHYEDYLITALLWIQAVLTKWLPQLSQVDGGEIGIFSPDYKNIQAIKQQLQGLWRQEHQLYFTTEATTEIWKTIQSQLYQL
ncbi:KATNB1-like protein 1 [Colossoma macropomum]|uniref:KATNB1-like protein 1 n=1 Tax=Colossoma macropomum TaxID=42526 RepID=UPI001863CF01|nr:KATNB1-like protein 1 [Colossoma macropomum]